jgi:hypothetical protein
MIRQALQILLWLAAFLSLVGIFVYNTNPILIKWCAGTARSLGAPTDATVYTNGVLNKDIAVYQVRHHWNGAPAKDYLLALKEYDKEGKLKYINIELTEKWIGRPVASSEDDYALNFGSLFQSETGGKFVPFQDDMKGFNFDPQLSYSAGEIRFKLPPHLLEFDSIRIVIKNAD